MKPRSSAQHMLWSALMCNKRALIRAEAELAEHEWVQRLRLVALIGTSVQTYQVSDRRFNPVLQPLFLCSFFFGRLMCIIIMCKEIFNSRKWSKTAALPRLMYCRDRPMVTSPHNVGWANSSGLFSSQSPHGPPAGRIEDIK